MRLQMNKIQRVQMKETIPHAVGKAMARNLYAGIMMTAERFGEKFDNWLNQQGISVRPFESIENKIKEVRLRKAGRKIKQTR